MKVVVAIDSFKGSLSSIEVAESVKKGITKVFLDADVKIVPLADGGEGTIEAITLNDKNKYIYVNSVDACKRNINSYYAIIDDTAIIEVATTAGLVLVRDNLDALNASSYGVGLQIKDALNKGIRKFIVGLGGSATNDGGMGMLEALGYVFYDNDDNVLEGKANNLAKIAKIDNKNVIPSLKEATFTLASDVKNPLCGLNGATYVYGKQKGLLDDDLKTIDKGMLNYADNTAKLVKKDYKNVEGAGAAGGLGFAFLAYTNAIIKSGIDLILSFTNFKEIIKDADYVITGEGKLDKQTIMGKAPVGVAKIAKENNKKVLLFAGGISDELDNYNNYGFDAYFPIVRGITTLDKALDKNIASTNITKTVEQVFRVIKLEKGM